MNIKNYLLLLLFLILSNQCTSLKNANSGTFKDKRDGQLYNWIRLKDNKIWMTQNLNYQFISSSCYGNKQENCEKYGRLYSWEMAIKACPKGWRLPTDTEWWEMTNYYGKSQNYLRYQEANNEKGSGKKAYNELIQGGNSKFSAIIGGYRYSDNKFYNIGDYGIYWSNTEFDTSEAWYYRFSTKDKTLRRSVENKSLEFSCRCIHD